MSNNRLQPGPNTPGSQQSPTQQCTKIYIQRDYSEGTSVKFQTTFPRELQDRIEKEAFDHTIERLNELFEMAEHADCSTYCEGCVGCLTAYLIYLCSETHYEKHLRKVSKFVSSQNERVYNPRGVHITDPGTRGLRVIEITILEPTTCTQASLHANANSTGNQNVRHS